MNLIFIFVANIDLHAQNIILATTLPTKYTNPFFIIGLIMQKWLFSFTMQMTVSCAVSEAWINLQ